MTKNTKKIPGYEIGVAGVYYSLNQDTGLKTKRHYSVEKFQFPKIVKYKEGMKKEVKVIDGQSIEKTVPKIVTANISQGNVARHLIWNYHLDDRLKEKYTDYIGVRTCEIFSKEKMDIEYRDFEGVKIQDMTASELNQFVTIRDLPVTLKDYDDLGERKIAVERAVAQKEKEDIAAGRTEGKSQEELLLEDAESGLLG